MPIATENTRFAVIKTGGKQYLVEEGQELRVEKLEKDDGEKVEFDALLVSDDEGKDAKSGTPTTTRNIPKVRTPFFHIGNSFSRSI